jgi:predicted transcriptional regulator YdeE
MQNYSHDAFQVTGYVITTTKKGNQELADIQAAWQKFMSQDIGSTIKGKIYPGIHTVYYNYTNPETLEDRGYDMMIGYMTDPTVIQDNLELTTIMIPAQDYLFTEVQGNPQTELWKTWTEINAMSREQAPRSFGYDLDMFSEDMSHVGVAIAVIKL